MNPALYLAVVCCALTCVAAKSVRIPISTVAVKGGIGRENVSQIDVGSVCIGTPCQNFTVMMDTGSADIWITSIQCDSDGCKKLHRYDCNKSSSCEEYQDSFSLAYGTGKVEIDLFKDNVMLAGILSEGQEIGQAKNTDEPFISNGIDGVLGLGFKSVSRTSMEPVFQHMVAQGHLDKPFFTFCKSREEGERNELIVGGTDEKLYKKKPIVAKLTETGYWKFSLDKITAGNSVVCEKGCGAIADSGTTTIRGPKPLVDQLNKELGATLDKEGNYKITCNRSSLPAVKFYVSGKPISMDPRQYVADSDDDVTCETNIGVSNADVDFWILGEIFFRGLCIEFHPEEKKLVFAPIDGFN